MIDMNKFKQVATLADEYNSCWSAINEANYAADQMIDAVKERITDEKKRDAERLAELQKRCADTETSETVKKMAMIEMNQIKERLYTTTDFELDTINYELDTMAQAIEDGRQIAKKLRESVWNATEEINKVKAETYGNEGKDFNLADHWLEDADKKVDRL